MPQLSPVVFHGDTIFVISHNDEPYTPMRPIVEGMGMKWAAQTVKLNSNADRWGVSIIETPSDGGPQQTLCMPVRKLPAFLASINPKKVREELRPKIELYQNECDNALWDYWTKGQAKRVPSPQPLTPSTIIDRKPLEKLLKVWAQRSGVPHAQCWTIVNAAFNLQHISDLPVEWIPDAIAIVQGKIDALPPAPAQSALPMLQMDRFETFLKKVEELRMRNEQEIHRLAVDGLKLIDIFKAGPDLHGECVCPLYDWLRLVVTSPTSLLTPWAGTSRGMIQFLRALDTRLSMK